MRRREHLAGFSHLSCRELIRRHHSRVYGYLRRLGADPGQAEDLTQETYTRAWQAVRKLRKAASLRSWLLTIARNEFFQQARAGRPEIAALDELPDRKDDTPGVEIRLVRNERELRRAVSRLEPVLRETVALHYFQGLSFRETGVVMGIPAGTVKSRVHRALGLLQHMLEPQEAEHETERTAKTLRDIRDPAPPSQLRDRLENGIPSLEEQSGRWWSRGSWTMMKVGTETATTAALVLLALWIGIGPGGSGTTIAATLDSVLQATDGARAVHVVLRMLTREGEDFSGRAGGVGIASSLLWPAAWVRQIRNRPDDDVEVLDLEQTGDSGRLVIRDLESQLLIDLRRWVLVDGERVLFSEVVTIDYLPAIDDAIFNLALPEGVRQDGISPGEVAQRFFDNAVRGDRAELELFCGSPATLDWLLDCKNRPTEVLYVGEPFRTGGYPGVYVPYMVRFGTGRDSVRTHNLALRNDNEQNRWIFDGGL